MNRALWRVETFLWGSAESFPIDAMEYKFVFCPLPPSITPQLLYRHREHHPALAPDTHPILSPPTRPIARCNAQHPHEDLIGLDDAFQLRPRAPRVDMASPMYASTVAVFPPPRQLAAFRKTLRVKSSLSFVVGGDRSWDGWLPRWSGGRGVSKRRCGFGRSWDVAPGYVILSWTLSWMVRSEEVRLEAGTWIVCVFLLRGILRVRDSGSARYRSFSLLVVFVIGLFGLDMDILPGCTFVALARTEEREPGAVTANLPVSQLELTTMFTDRIAIMLHQLTYQRALQAPTRHAWPEAPVPNDPLTNPIRML